MWVECLLVLVLLAPTRSELQTLMTICERYALEHNLTFSTDPSPAQSKSKCLLFKLHNGEGLPAPIVLNGQKLLGWIMLTTLGTSCTHQEDKRWSNLWDLVGPAANQLYRYTGIPGLADLCSGYLVSTRT